jgi:hypothetical protein
MKAVKSNSGEASLALVIASGLLLRLALFHLPGLGFLAQIMEQRPELSTPISSFTSGMCNMKGFVSVMVHTSHSF